MNNNEQFEAWFMDKYDIAAGVLNYASPRVSQSWSAWQAASKASEQQLSESRREFTAANATIHNLELKVAQVVAENAGLINSSVCTLQDSRPPHGFYASEWFIAKLKNGEYAALKALPEEYSYDYCTNDGTYYTNDWVVGWMQTPDTEYRPNIKTPATDTYLAEVRAQAIRDALDEYPDYLDTDCVMERLDISYEDAELRTYGAAELNDALVEFAAQLRQGAEHE